MKGSSTLIFLSLQCSIAFSQTDQPDIYEPNNTLGNTKEIATFPNPTMQAFVFANFNDANDTSDWYNIYVGHYPEQMGQLNLLGPMYVINFHMEIKQGNQPTSPAKNSNFPYKIRFFAYGSDGIDQPYNYYNGDNSRIIENPGTGTADFSYVLSCSCGTAGICPRQLLLNVFHDPGIDSTIYYTILITFKPYPPQIIDFTPTSGGSGTVIKILGNDLYHTNTVKFNGKAATSISPLQTRNDLRESLLPVDTVFATVPPDATTGPISIITNNGVATSSSNFVVTSHSIKDSLIKTDATKALTGKVYLGLPADDQCFIYIYAHGTNKEITGTSKDRVFYMAPGVYDIKVSSVKMEEIKVTKGTDTKILAGTLNITSSASWQLFDESQKIRITGASRPEKVGLPVGNYNVKINDSFHPVTIKDGETVNF